MLQVGVDLYDQRALRNFDRVNLGGLGIRSIPVNMIVGSSLRPEHPYVSSVNEEMLRDDVRAGGASLSSSCINPVRSTCGQNPVQAPSGNSVTGKTVAGAEAEGLPLVLGTE